MANDTNLEERVKALEADVAKIKTKLPVPRDNHWLNKFIGAFADEPAFDDVIRFGKEWRKEEPLTSLDEEATP